jgi:hypothetical protein
MGVSSPAFNSSGRKSWYGQQMAWVLMAGLTGGSTARKLGHKGTKFFAVNAAR